METAIFILVFLLLLLLNVPISYAMLGSSILFIAMADVVAYETLVQRVVAGVNSFPLMAVPLFILAGDLMNRGGITERLIAFAQSIVGHITGGMGHVSIVTSMILAGMSGSATADAAGSGVILIPALKKCGYTPGYAAAITASSATIGPIIPPSITMIVYGVAAGTSVARLFAGGILPGILMGVMLAIFNWLIVKNMQVQCEQRASIKDLLKSFKTSFVALLMPLIVLGGILFGVVTPTEAGALAVVYSIIISVFIYKKMDIHAFNESLLSSLKTTAKIAFIIASASMFGWILTYQNITSTIADIIFSITTNPLLILLIINIFFLIIGCFMETVAVIIMAVPVFIPLLPIIGVDPIHFGVIVTLNLMLGTLTPPVGVLMVIVKDIAGITVFEYIKSNWLLFTALLLCLILITYVPAIVLWLPSIIF